MTRVLVVEGNTPEVLAAKAEAGGLAPAEQYAAALRRFAPALEITIARPFCDPADVLIELEGIDGVALTGSGVAWAADAPQARPHRRLVERVFAAGIPVLGSCWGLQVGAVILGGSVGASPLGIEVPAARAVTLTAAGRAHALHADRPAVFDVPCIHRDEVTRAPSGAVITAANDHSAIQATVYEHGGVRLWGVQYHPEHGADIALGYLLARGAEGITGLARPLGETDLNALHADLGDAAGQAALARADRRGLGVEVFCPDRRGAELRAWLRSIGALRGEAHPIGDAPPPRAVAMAVASAPR
ncbi:MAG: type 1 glutamine amidotransferase [Pseudomonadota bacterium]